MAWPRLAAKDILSPTAGEAKWLIRPFIPAGALIILAASYKSGKSWFAYQLALDAVRKVQRWGVLEEALDVVVFQGEMPYHEDCRRWHRLAVGNGCLEELGKLVNRRLHLYSRPMALNLKDAPDAFRIACRGAQLVIIDSLMTAFPGLDVNANQDIRWSFTRAFYQVVAEGASIVLLHHVRKPDNTKARKGKEVEPDANDVLGAQAICASADLIYTLTPVEGQVGMMRLRNQGSWGPCEKRDWTIKRMDVGDGTIVTPVT